MSKEKQSSIAFQSLFLSTSLVLLLASFVAFLDVENWLLELSSHFVLQNFVLSFVLLIFFLLTKKRNAALVSLCSLALGLCHLLPLFDTTGLAETQLENATKYKILLANVYTKNETKEGFLRLVEKTNPDFLVVIELSDEWSNSLRKLQSFSKKLIVPREDNFGIGIYSKSKYFKKAEVVELAEGLPMLHARLDIQGYILNLLSIHVPPPVSDSAKGARDRMIEQVARYVRLQQEPSIVCGDFNTTPWTKSYRLFELVSRLYNAQRGFMIKGTWNSLGPFFRIPIDHCFLPRDVRVVNHQSFKVAGSDHNALLVELLLPKQPS